MRRLYAWAEQIMRDCSSSRGRGTRGCCKAGRAHLRLSQAVRCGDASSALHKVKDYDRMAFAGRAYNEYENLRVAGIRLADLRGVLLNTRRDDYPCSRQRLRPDARHDLHRAAEGMEVEIRAAEVGEISADDRSLYLVSYDMFDRGRAGLPGHGWPCRYADRRGQAQLPGRAPLVDAPR